VGPLVIHGRDEAKTRVFPYVTDRVVLLNDWYYDSASALMREVLSPGNEDSPIPNAALINGLNQVNCSLHPNRDCYTENTYLPTMNLAPEANHRIRFVNAGGYAWFQVSIDEHMSLPIVEIDGTTVEPAPESDIVLAPGQRYSIILTTDIGDYIGIDAFWLRARMIKACFAQPKIPENGVDEAKAIIRYTPSPLDHPSEPGPNGTLPLPTTNNTNTNNPMICKDMTARRSYRPSPQLPAPESADQSWYVRVNLAIGNWRLQRGVMNSSSLRPNLEAPTLQRLLDGLAAGNASFAAAGINKQAFNLKHELVVSHARLETVDVVVQNMDENNHPFHLHGNQFWVLAAGHGYFPGYAKLNLRPGGRGLLDPADRTIVENPLRRDVATAEGFGWTLLRFVADNPGVWLFHCHMIWHSEAGMGMQFVSRLDDMRGWKIPPEARQLCDAPPEELAKGAPPPDEVFYGFHNQR
jgi:FtsP/CotA-like multicopper oxidase with cupredoxin domain